MKHPLLRAAARHLFASPFDSAITVTIVAGLCWMAIAMVQWASHEADWSAVTANLDFLLAGVSSRKLDGNLWWVAIVLCAFMGAVSWMVSSRFPAAKRSVAPLWLAALVALALFVQGIGVEQAGGLLLSIFTTALVAALTFPLGVLLAVGRRSRHAAVQVCCTAFVECMRSLPLLLVVYLVWLAMPLMSASLAWPDFWRGLIGLVIFFSAYASEYVRSGLQSIPKGQFDAARALGMSNFQAYRYVVFPQALQVITPTLVGSVLDIFNATPLLFIIGMTDLLRAGQLVLASPAYTGKELEIYSALLVTYLALGSVLTFAARRLEAR
jgi:general L-amino acid transport system permease protein